jgi:hypothetical protein
MVEYNTYITWKDHFSIHEYLQVVHSSVTFHPCVPKSRDSLVDTSLVARKEIQRTVAECCSISYKDFLVRVHTESAVLRLYIPGFFRKMPRVWQKRPFGLTVLSVLGSRITEIS